MKLISVLRFQICMSSHRDAFGATLKLSKSSRTFFHHDMCELLTSIGFHPAWNFIVRSPLAEGKQCQFCTKETVIRIRILSNQLQQDNVLTAFHL